MSLNSILKDKRGFTLVEMMVTTIVLALVTAMVAQATWSIYRTYERAEVRWQIQNETKLVMQQLENSQTGVKSSAVADLMYYEDLSNLPSFDPSLAATQSSLMVVVEPEYLRFTYIFTVPDPNDPNMSYLWKGCRLLGAGENGENYIYKQVSTIPLSIKFEIPVRPPVRVEKQTQNPDGSVTSVYEDDLTHPNNNIYLTKCVKVELTGLGKFNMKYSLESTMALDNMFDNKDVNITDGVPTNEFVAGWTNVESNKDTENSMKIPVDFNTFPNSVKPGNVIRYIPINEYYSSGEGVDPDDYIKKDSLSICSTRKAMVDSSMETFVLGSMRDFRDNVLSKTEAGKNIIDYYYNSWSPAWNNAISSNENLSKLYKAIIIPVAFAANIFS